MAVNDKIYYQRQNPGTLKLLVKRFGYTSTVAIIPSTIGIIGAAILWILIWQHFNDPSISTKGGIWTRLALAGWTTQFITITSAIFRVSISAQVFLLSLMLASLALEHGQICKDNDVGMIVVYQYAYPGSFTLVGILLRKVKGNPLASIAAILLFLEALSAQMTSTILVTDFRSVELDTGPSKPVDVNFTYSDLMEVEEVLGQKSAFKSSMQAGQYPIFAEMPGDRFVYNNSGNTGSGSPGLTDSGNTIRAFIPLDIIGRTSLASYQGPAKLVNAHFICFSPQLNSISVNISSIGEIDEYSYIAKIASLKLGSQNREILSKGSISFNNVDNVENMVFFHDWSIGAGLSNSMDQDTFTFNPVALGLDPSGINPLPTPDFPGGMFSNKRPVPLGSITDWLLVSKAYWDPNERYQAKDILPEDAVQSFDGSEWTTISWKNAPSFKLRQSLCSSRISFGPFDISVRAPSSYTEPKLNTIKIANASLGLDFNINKAKRRFLTSEVRKKFGVDGPIRKTEHERGILKLSSFKVNQNPSFTGFNTTFARTLELVDNNETSTRPGDHDPGATTQPFNYYWVLLMNLYEFGKLIIQARDGLSVLEFEDEGFVPPQGEALFLDTLNSTGQLSLALESLIMGIMSSHYAQHLNYFDRSAKATIGYFKPYSVPQQYTGLGIVLGIIALHLVLVISILVSFLRSRTFKHWDEDEIRDLGRKHQRDVDGREKPRLLYAQVNSEY